jgi:hypothetical protein
MDGTLDECVRGQKRTRFSFFLKKKEFVFLPTRFAPGKIARIS